MTDSKINAIIAELFGWDKCPFDDISYYVPMLGRKAVASNICNDLNAMHEAELKLSSTEQDAFAGFLGAITGGRQIDRGARVIRCSTKTLFATARQRAEAFLRTLGKWKE